MTRLIFRMPKFLENLLVSLCIALILIDLAAHMMYIYYVNYANRKDVI